MNYREILKRSLEDPIIKGIDCISPNSVSQLRRVIQESDPGALISEWRYGPGQVKYIYRKHENGINPILQEAFQKGVRGGNPKLTGLYSIPQLQTLVRSYENHSE